MANKPYAIILPAHNEASTISHVLNEALKTHASAIIVVDDGSTDKTANIVTKIAKSDRRVQLIQHHFNRGYGAALRTGVFTAGASENILFFDSDISNAAATQMERIIEPILENDSDYSIGDSDNFGRVAEFLAKPLIKKFIPGLIRLNQPMSGLFAVKRKFIFPDRIASDYAIMGVLLDAHFSGARITEVKIGEIIHDKRPNEVKVNQAISECDVFFRKLEEYNIAPFDHKNTVGAYSLINF